MPYVMVQIPNTPAPTSPSAPRSVPTSADVARLAGVSRATVSYVLNDTGAVRISEPTRRRVHRAAEELGYVPHAAARSLRAGHSRMVLMPAPPVPAGPLHSQFVHDFQGALSRLDYTVVQYGNCGLHGDEAARAWAELRPVAVLVPGPGLGPRGVAVLKRSGARAVVTFGTEPVDGAHALLTDHAGVGRGAARHLYARGRRRIGVVVPEEPGLETFSAPRLDGARWRDLGLDGVFAYNDEYAMLLMSALQDEGVRVPEDAAVIGADDLMLARLLRPRLSTVRITLPSGRGLAELVDRAVRNPGATPESHELFDATVVQRDST
ncbi:LacI family DNA-binding transcriptional regulator [Streptomyces galilaeus]|uniref:LacI family DNA-binding transcriptional regulator n=1 Tax=Streptomyces galilaeus TaxID=33899 RepID=UPI0038F6047F